MNNNSHEVEEGEIIDDDLEDISDNSIVDSTFGKFTKANHHLRALSLSSISDSERPNELLPPPQKTKKPGALTAGKSKRRRRPCRRQRREISDRLSKSGGSVTTCHELKYNLNRAIHISGAETIKNDLQFRLQAMVGAQPQHNNKPEAEPLEPSPDNSLKVEDKELENLRIEALKTAILNKHQRRKRKKALIENPSQEQEVNNKENEQVKPQVEIDKVTNTDNRQIDQQLELEEDEDLLRASLLAGLAKKITENATSQSKLIDVVQTRPKLPNIVTRKIARTNVIVKRTNSKLVLNNNTNKVTVKPLIIKLNEDSDTEEEVATEKLSLDRISSSVDRFLKEERQKFEQTVAIKPSAPSPHKSQLQKSALKLLPKSQQLEYQRLVKRLRNAENRKLLLPRVVKKAPPAPPAIVKAPAVNTDETVLPKVKLDVGKEIELSLKQIEAEKKNSGVIRDLTVLQKMLKEIRVERNGSLQMKTKYHSLKPSMKKINEASSERKEHERRIRRLLEELNDARMSLNSSHRKFSSLVKELMIKKEEIDKRCEVPEPEVVPQPAPSAPEIDRTVIQNSVKKPQEKPDDELVKRLVTSTPIKVNSVDFNNQDDNISVSTIVTTTSSTNNECEDMDVCNSEEEDKEIDTSFIDIVDPNDIDQIYKPRLPIVKTIPDYISPLNNLHFNNNNNNRCKNGDPLGIMCPFEVNGSCRDLECSFKHYLCRK